MIDVHLFMVIHEVPAAFIGWITCSRHRVPNRDRKSTARSKPTPVDVTVVPFAQLGQVATSSHRSNRVSAQGTRRGEERPRRITHCGDHPRRTLPVIGAPPAGDHAVATADQRRWDSKAHHRTNRTGDGRTAHTNSRGLGRPRDHRSRSLASNRKISR